MVLQALILRTALSSSTKYPRAPGHRHSRTDRLRVAQDQIGSTSPQEVWFAVACAWSSCRSGGLPPWGFPPRKEKGHSQLLPASTPLK